MATTIWKKKTIQQSNQSYWENIDVDLTRDRISNPQDYPFKSR